MENLRKIKKIKAPSSFGSSLFSLIDLYSSLSHPSRGGRERGFRIGKRKERKTKRRMVWKN